jgi:hypothetical protein
MPWVVILSIPDLDLGKKDDTVDQPQDEDVVEEGDQIGDEEVGDDGDEIVVDPLTEQLTELAKKLAELNTLSLNDLK